VFRTQQQQLTRCARKQKSGEKSAFCFPNTLFFYPKTIPIVEL